MLSKNAPKNLRFPTFSKNFNKQKPQKSDTQMKHSNPNKNQNKQLSLANDHDPLFFI
jgi:hypothetical protein